MNTRAITVAVVVILCALLLAGLAATLSRGVAQPEVTAATPANKSQSPRAPVSPPTSPQSIPRVTAAALQEKIGRGEVVVLDVRDIDSYTASHIPGAMHIPLSYIESELPYLPRSKPIVTYCT